MKELTIDKMLDILTKLKNKVGGDHVIPVMISGCGENDYIIPEYAVVGDLEDQDGNTFKCAFIGNNGGEELTQKGVAHYNWNPEKQKIV